MMCVGSLYSFPFVNDGSLIRSFNIDAAEGALEIPKVSLHISIKAVLSPLTPFEGLT